MSTGNIAYKRPSADLARALEAAEADSELGPFALAVAAAASMTIIVGFHTRDGSIIEYEYGGLAVAPILAGKDPAEYSGTRLD